VERDAAVAFLESLSRDELVQLLRDVEAFQRDELGAAIADALEAKDAPLTELNAACVAVIAWAKGDKVKELYADELNDIARRIAGDMQAPARAR
jgi:hypothetical protein